MLKVIAKGYDPCSNFLLMPARVQRILGRSVSASCTVNVGSGSIQTGIKFTWHFWSKLAILNLIGTSLIVSAIKDSD